MDRVGGFHGHLHHAGGIESSRPCGESRMMPCGHLPTGLICRFAWDRSKILHD